METSPGKMSPHEAGSLNYGREALHFAQSAELRKKQKIAKGSQFAFTGLNGGYVLFFCLRCDIVQYPRSLLVILRSMEHSNEN